MFFTASGWCSATQAGTKNDAVISAWRRSARMRGSASWTPKVPCESVTGSLTPRASQSVSASRSNVNAQAARAPRGHRGAVIAELASGRALGTRRTVPRDRETEREPSVGIPPAGLLCADGRLGRRPPGEAKAAGTSRRLVLPCERLDERRIVLDHRAGTTLIGPVVEVARPSGLALQRRRHDARLPLHRHRGRLDLHGRRLRRGRLRDHTLS